MTDDIPVVTLGLGAESQQVVMLGDGTQEATDLAQLMALAPGLAQPAAALDAAQAVNHLAQGAAFEVIADPAAFAEAYRAQLASEDPDAPWSQDKPRLSDYGVPDFDAIHPPQIDGGVLTFYARDTYLGVPYSVTVDLAAPQVQVDDDSYDPLPLTPVPGKAPPAGSGGTGIVDEDEED